MVEGEFTSSERQNTENRYAIVNHQNGCFRNTLGDGGAVCQGTTMGGTWSYQERTKDVNVLESITVKLVILTFTRGKPVTAVHLQIDNMTALYNLVKMGGNSQSKTVTSSQRNVGLSVIQSYSSYSRVLTKQSEYSDKLAIQKSQGFKRLEIEPQNIFSDSQIVKIRGKP